MVIDQRYKDIIDESVKTTLAETKPNTINEKLLTGGVTLIGLMGICVVVSLGCWAIIEIWRHAL